jgi:hypothetical protein
VNLDHREVHAFNLDYSEILHTSLDEVLCGKVEEHWDSYFFTKAEDWSSEIEWRWVLCGQDSEPEHVSIKHSLRAIILGVDFPQVYEPAVVVFGERYQVPIARIHWYNGRPSALPGPFEPDA